MKNIFFTILTNVALILLFNSLFAQNDNSFFFSNKELIPSDTNKLSLHITEANFLKNNEYFNEIENGYTYFGLFLQPEIVYYPSPNTKFEGGLHLLKYFGRNDFTQVLPVFSFSYKPLKSVTFVIGTLAGTINHQIIEPLYQFDHYYSNNVEDGIQLLIDTKYFQSDTWLHWENFILQNESSKEQFSFGSNTNVYLSDPKSNNVLYLPLQVLIFHRGGQYENDSIPLQTIENSATGIAFEHTFNNAFIKSIGIKNYFCTYNDLSGVNQYKYSQGWGESSNFLINSKYVDLMLGYWYGEYFIAPEGEPLFLSNSLKYSYYYDGYRNLITGKFQIHKDIAKGIKIGLRFESYYEFAKKDFDFSYGLNLILNRDFFIGKIK